MCSMVTVNQILVEKVSTDNLLLLQAQVRTYEVRWMVLDRLMACGASCIFLLHGCWAWSYFRVAPHGNRGHRQSQIRNPESDVLAGGTSRISYFMNTENQVHPPSPPSSWLLLVESQIITWLSIIANLFIFPFHRPLCWQMTLMDGAWLCSWSRGACGTCIA